MGVLHTRTMTEVAGAVFLLSACVLQTFLMEHAVTRLSRPAFVIVQISVYVAAAAIVGLLSTHDKDFLGPGPLPDVRPGFWGWWYNPEVTDYVKLPFMANPWYVHAGNLFYGFTNAYTIWCVWQCMVVREKVKYGRVHGLIASFAFCSGALGHLSQYLGFYGPSGDFMDMGMRVFVYFQGQVTSFYPVIWICYNRCSQAHVGLVLKAMMVGLSVLQTVLFTVVESGFFESISVGPNDMSYCSTQGWWHFQHVMMHVGYAGASSLCVYTMPTDAWNYAPKAQPPRTNNASELSKKKPANAAGGIHPFVKFVLVLEGLFALSVCYMTRLGMTDSISIWVRTELFGDNYHGAVIFGSAIGAIGGICLLTVALGSDPRVALICTFCYHLSCASLYILEESDPWNKKAPKHYVLSALNMIGMLAAIYTHDNRKKVHVD